jgi:pimeloyl-ACP methyl ester carboxylesterase
MKTVKSADGTVIAYDAVGVGPVLIVSVGAFCTRHSFAPGDLARQFTVVTYDRRGRGDSGDTGPFAPEREFEDLAAVAAAGSTEPPFVFGDRAPRRSGGDARRGHCRLRGALHQRRDPDA